MVKKFFLFLGCVVVYSQSVFAHCPTKYYVQLGVDKTQKSAQLRLKRACALHHVKGHITKRRYKGKMRFEVWLGPYSRAPRTKALSSKPRKRVKTPCIQKTTKPIPAKSLKETKFDGKFVRVTRREHLGLRPAIAIGGGVNVSTNLGSSQSFPIVNPVTDEFYRYYNASSNNAVGMFDIFAGAEWDTSSPWGLQFGLSFNQRGQAEVKGMFVQGADEQSADTYTYRYHVIARQLLAEGKLFYHYSDVVMPYVLVGLGSSLNRASSYATNVPPFLTFTRMYQNNQAQTSFSYALGIGVDAGLTSQLRFGVGYRFSDYGQIKLGSAVIDTTPVSGTLSQSHFYTNGFLAQVTWVK